MTLKETLEKIACTGSARNAIRVADALRFRCGLNYDESATLVQKLCPSLTPERWEALLYEGETAA